MSTRCHIVVRGSKDEPVDNWAYIYHHHDGYPDGVGKDLVGKFRECIGSNACGHKYTWEDIVEYIVGIDDGYEIDYGIHGDEDYVYVVTLLEDREGVFVECYHVLPFSFAKDADSFSEDNGYEYVSGVKVHNTESGLLDTKEEKSFMESFKGEIQKLHNVELLEMMKILCTELTLRETE